MRVIARLSVGGAPTQAIALSRLMAPNYETTLVTGKTSPGEVEMTAQLDQYGVTPVRIADLRREIGTHDVRALAAIRGLIRTSRPAILHTHAAKGGVVGRLAAMLNAGKGPQVIVHTYHGHVLKGYFPPRKAQVFTELERTLARKTTCLIAVSSQVKAELLELGVGEERQYRVVEDGFDLQPFLLTGEPRMAERRRVRHALGISQEAIVVTLFARLVAIKRVDRFLRIVARLRAVSNLRFLVVGDGELRHDLTVLARTLGVEQYVTWTGFRHDIPSLCFASDVVVLTSDSEGAPVSLIEAQAAGVPVVATDVGGTRSVVTHGHGGYLVSAGDESGFAELVSTLLRDPDQTWRMGGADRERVVNRYSTERLRRDLLALYQELLESNAQRSRLAGAGGIVRT
jgi:glycosyltransferase involved in cell wall biosynthesis